MLAGLCPTRAALVGVAAGEATPPPVARFAFFPIPCSHVGPRSKI